MPELISVAIELKTNCQKCDGTIHINALTEKILCPSCGEELNLNLQLWNDILEDPIKEAPNYEEGEGTNSTVMGGINYQIMYGKQIPRFPDSKKNIDILKSEEYSEKGFVEDPDTGKKYSFRKVPVIYEKDFPGALYLAMEDFGLISGDKESSQESAVKAHDPVAFACPKCGGFLDVDGKDRMIKCSFCNASVYLPDDLWKRIHPVETVTRWFIIMNERERPFTWDSDAWDMVLDGENNIYLAVETDRSKMELVSLDKDRTRRWTRKDLEYYPETSNGDTRLAIDGRGRLMLWSGDKNTLLFLSTLTGETEDMLGGRKGKQPGKGNERFSMKNAICLFADNDDTFVVLLDRDKKDTDENCYYELMRYDYDGNAVDVWRKGETEKNIFGKIKSFFSGTRGAQYFESLKDKPKRFRDRDIKISLGYDCVYYFLCHEKLIKYSREGKKQYFVKLDCSYTYSRAYGDKDGNAYVLCSDGNDKRYVLKISPDGKQMTRHLLSVLDDGVVCSEEILALSEDGTFYLAGYSGRMRIVANNGKQVYRSEEAKEDEERTLEEKRRKED
ncbi:hypothetical protein JXL83_02085 [candidate division WOR-3 bacterium]|nr:hypothetical protein [candidate division WOR-3 bacterium]